eukprot:11478013-Karenia_brevis.AAC.1
MDPRQDDGNVLQWGIVSSNGTKVQEQCMGLTHMESPQDKGNVLLWEVDQLNGFFVSRAMLNVCISGSVTGRKIAHGIHANGVANK